MVDRETAEQRRKRAGKIFEILHKTYPTAKCSLDFKNPLELLVATILSAQCTDVRVNMVTKSLFKKFRTAHDYAFAPRQALEEAIRSTGFYKAKARSIQLCCMELDQKHGGKVPKTMEELVKLQGVGRKTANVVLGNAFGISGVVVDTHVDRLAHRMELTGNADRVKIEFDLQSLLPEKNWTLFSHLLIVHGREVCTARSPHCGDCPVFKYCPSGPKLIKGKQ